MTNRWEDPTKQAVRSNAWLPWVGAARSQTFGALGVQIQPASDVAQEIRAVHAELRIGAPPGRRGWIGASRALRVSRIDTLLRELYLCAITAIVSVDEFHGGAPVAVNGTTSRTLRKDP